MLIVLSSDRVRSMAALLIVALVAAGCAHGPVTERLGLYQGEDIEGLKGLTFDGEAFKARGAGTIARNDVQVVSFKLQDRKGKPGKESVGDEALTPLAMGLVERGNALAAAHPGVGGVILVDDGEFVYRPDGTHMYRYHFAGLVLKEEMKSWAQVVYGFTEGRSRVRVLFARSVNPNGTIHRLSPDGLKVGSPSEDVQFFNPNRKILSGLIPGVEVGSIVEYSYEYENYNPEDPRLFSPGYYFQGTEPVAYSRVRVEVPKEIPFQYMTRNFAEDSETKSGTVPDFVVEETQGTRVYTWLSEDMPPITPEPLMPPQRDIVPMMDASIFASFEEVFDLLAGLQKPRIELTPEIEAKVAEITEGADTTEDKLARIYHWMQENTRYISIKGSLGSGMSGHTAQETFENRYGDCTDKAILFATMCEAIGVTSYPIILTTNDEGTGVTEIPTLSGNHAINEVVVDGRGFYLDTTAQNYRYPYFRADDHGALALNAIRGDIKPIPVPEPSANRRFSHLDVVLAPNGDVTVQTRNAYTGNIEAGIRGFWKRTREDNRKAMMTDYVNSISPGAVLDDFTLSDLDDLDTQLTMGIDYALPGHAIRAKDLMYMRMPTLERDYGEAALETRRYAIEYRTTEERILEIDLELPRGFRAKWLPPALEIANPYLEFNAAYEEDGNAIRFRESFRRLERVVPPEDYADYRDALRAIAEFSKQEIFLTEQT